MIGAKLGNYRIREPLGAGGMGEVYRAHDHNLRRDVAIKVLPQEVSGDADRLARLEREAHLLAALNHPNIATIFGLEEIDGTRFLVLELIEGESLQQRLERGPLPIEEALDICGQIARALEVAHQADIVHRDLKPANVLITPDDRVKVLDFGIAKTLAPLDDDDPEARATALTATGTLVGTAPYMSPEQVRGEAVDKRSDVWAFGCILFETLSGTGPFTRETVADTLAAIVGEEPHWEALPAEASPAVRMLMHRCLQKNPKVRQRDVGDAWVEINQSRSHPGGVPMSMPPTLAAGGGTRLRGAIVAAIAIGALAVGALLGGWFAAEAPAHRVPRYFDFELPPGGALPSGSGPTLAISPDGTRVVMVAEGGFGRRLFLHRLDERGEPQPIPGTDGAAYPFFSPDGTTIAFDAPDGSIESISLDGGNTLTLCRRCRHGAWGDDNSIIVQDMADDAASPWARIAAPGAEEMEPLPVPRRDGEALQPDRIDVLPGARAVLFEEDRSIYAFALDTEELVLVQRDAWDPYYAGGFVLFPRDNTLYALPFDRATLQAGDPIVARRGINTEAGGALHAAVSRRDGVLVYAPVETETTLGFSLRWVDRTGGWEEIASDDRNGGAWPRVSPDGDKIAFGMAPNPAGIWLFDARTKAVELFHRVDHETILDLRHPVWSRDGASITFRETRATNGAAGPRREFAIVRKLVGGARPTEILYTLPTAGHTPAPASWTPDDARLIYRLGNDSLRVLAPGNDGVWRDTLVIDDAFDGRAPTLSHDGKWLAYVANRFGVDAVYVRPFPEGDEIKVSRTRGAEPRWGPGDRELFYIADGRLVAAHLRIVDGRFTIDEHEELFDLTEYPGNRQIPARYDVHPDGNRFALIRPDSVDDTHAVHVVTDWFAEITRRAGERR